MRTIHGLSALLVVLGSLSVVNADSPQVVDLGYAIYQGTFISTSNITDFFSIRYAAPPVGKLRFQEPAPPPNMRDQGIQLANTQPPSCPSAGQGNQISTPFRGLPGNSRRQNQEIEDCLFLKFVNFTTLVSCHTTSTRLASNSVHVSGEIDPNARMPVSFYVHGGGYVALSTRGMNGADLVREAGGGIVAVELEYRLGVFGFLPGSEVKKNGALNAGLLDQQFALEWIQQFIHLFGGDPNQVTIWGQSAGAGSIIQHVVAHGGNTQPPLFQRAITSSTFLPSQYNFDDPVPEKIYSEVVRLAGCDNATDTFQCLSNVDSGILEGANVEVNGSGFFGTFVMVPVVDGEFIIERPIVTIERGTLNGNNFLAVTNQFEGGLFVNPSFSDQLTITDYVTQLFPLFNDDQIQQTVQQYTNIGLDTVNDQAIAIMGESIFICPSYRLLNAFPDSFKGLFAVPPAQHGQDVAFYFPGTTGPTFNNAQFSASFAGAFTAFIKSGNPNVHPVPDVVTPTWLPFNNGHTEMLFNRTEDFQPDIGSFETDPALLNRCGFWESVAPSIPQ